MESFQDTLHRMESAAFCMLLGHQIGQWSERRWWSFLENDPSRDGLSVDLLLDPEWTRPALQNPPPITTPGWGPTGFGDLVPHICALGMEYTRQDGPLTPELFRDFLLRKREWLRPQAVGRVCVELMSEGMNPRIAGLYAPSLLSACWIAWPVAFYHVAYPDHAYEDAVLLARAQVGGDGVILVGLIAAMLASALSPDSTWEDARTALLSAADKRDTRIAALVRYALDAGNQAADGAEWVAAIRKNVYRRQICKFNVDWIIDFYASVAGLEFFASHSTDVPHLMQSLLSVCDSRFGSMIALSLLAALNGTESIPGIWREQTRELHGEILYQWVDSSAHMLKKKLYDEVRVAGEILPLTHDDHEKSALYDRILAGFLAGAIGNVMGSPVEDRDYPWIVEHYGVLDRILSPERLESEDDAAMTRLWAETYIRYSGWARVEDLAEMFREKLARSGYYYDTQHAYDLLLKGIPPHASGHWNIVTGSAMMGCYPCGVYHAGDPRSAASNALELAYHYQRGFDVYGASIMCAALAEALRPDATVKSVLEAAIEAAPADPITYFNRHNPRDARSHLKEALTAMAGCPDVLTARKPLYEGYLEYNGQDPWEVVTYTLCIFKVANGDVWQCMLGGANIGRDSDTIANLSATLAACLQGTAAIPEHLLSLFNESTMSEYQRLAREMTNLVQSRCNRSLQTARHLGVVK